MEFGICASIRVRRMWIVDKKENILSRIRRIVKLSACHQGGKHMVISNFASLDDVWSFWDCKCGNKHFCVRAWMR